MAEDIPLGDAKTPSIDPKVVSELADKVSNAVRTLGKIAEKSNTTGESIGELLKKERKSLTTLEEMADSLKKVANSNLKMQQDAEEQRRESKVEGGAGTKGTEELKTTQRMKLFNEELESVLDKFRTNNLTIKGIVSQGLVLKTKLSTLGQIVWREYIGPAFAQGAGIFLGAMSTAVPKLIDNLRIIFRPLASLLNKFGAGSRIVSGISNFFNSLSGFATSGQVFTRTLNFITKFFGAGSGRVFQTAFRLGAQIGKLIPFLAIIPTAIETVVSAFGMIMKGDFKGAFKSVIVGLLKGLAAFFTLGLSDLIFDFDRMFKSISAPLDNFFKLFEDLFTSISTVFSGVYHMVEGVMKDFILPISYSLFNDILRPLGDALGAIGDAVMSVVGVIINLVVVPFKPIILMLKILAKGVFEFLKFFYDYFLGPILKYVLGPVVMGILKVVGAIFTGVKFFFMGIKWVFDKINDFFSFIFGIMDSNTNEATSSISAIYDGIRWLFGFIGGIIKDGIIAYVKFWWNTFKKVLDVMLMIPKAILGFLMPIWDAITQWWSDVIDGFAYLFEFWMEKIDAVLSSISKWWGELVMGFYGVIEFWTEKVEMVKASISKWWSELVMGFYGVIEFWQELVGGLIESVTGWWNDVLEGIGYIFDVWGELVDEMWECVKIWWNDLLDGIGYVFDVWNEMIMEGANYILEPIMSLFQSVKDGFQKILDAVLEYLGPILKWFGIDLGKKMPEEKEPAPMPYSERAGEPQPVAFQSALSPSTILPYSEAGDDELKRLMTQKVKSGLLTGQLPDEKQSPEWNELNAELKRREAMRGGASVAPVVVTAPTTNISGGGGGAIPVPLSPNPIRHSDPTRGLIST